MLQLHIEPHPPSSKLGQQIIPRRINHSAPMLTDQLGHYLLVLFQSLDRGRLVFGHQAAVTGQTGAENNGKFSLELVLRYEPPPWSKGLANSG